MAEYDIPEELRYTKEDEWVRRDGEHLTIGVTDYAQQQLGDVVFVELPEAGRQLSQGEAFGVIESVKAVSDLYAPVAGEVVASNGELANHPERVNESCYGEGWMVTLAPSSPEQIEALLDAAAYRRHVDEREKE